jgi:ferric-dicitrate binding protein FerR (iron transport regulator)
VRQGSLFVEIGEIFVRAKGFFEVKTEFVTAGTRGTEYLTRVSPREGATVVVLEGSVRCESQKLSWPEFVLESGQKATFESESAGVVPAPGSPAERPPQRIELPFTEAASANELAFIRRWVSQVDRIAQPP